MINEDFLVKAVNASFYNTYEFNTLRQYNKMWEELLVKNYTLNDHERRDFVKDLYLMCQYEVGLSSSSSSGIML